MPKGPQPKHPEMWCGHYAHGQLLESGGPYEFLLVVGDLMDSFRPSSGIPPWSWDDEIADLANRLCCCRTPHVCDRVEPGWYQAVIEAAMESAGGWIGPAVRAGNGFIRNGHHRIVAASVFGIKVPVVVSLTPGIWWQPEVATSA